VRGGFWAKTTSKNYAVRLFYFLFSTCLYNLWVLTNVYVGRAVRRILERPVVTAKLFGVMLYRGFWVGDWR
jgi:putative transposase